MRYFFFLIVTNFITGGCSQDKCNTLSDIPSLRQFTYPIMAVKTLAYPLGSCFFVKKDTFLFLVTAKHIITGYSPFTTEQINSDYDTVCVFFPLAYSTIKGCETEDIKNLKLTLPNDSLYKSADVVVIPMYDTVVKNNVNAIDLCMFENWENMTIGKFSLYGYSKEDTLKAFTSETEPEYYEGNITNTKPNYPLNDTVYYCIGQKSKVGMSGAPLFVTASKNKNNNEHLVFAGVAFGKDTVLNLAYIAKPETVKKRIFNFINRKLLPN